MNEYPELFQEVAKLMLHCAVETRLSPRALVADPELAKVESRLLGEAMCRVSECGADAIDHDTVSSLFTFFFAKAAEAATDLAAHVNIRQPDLDGLLDGRTPINADPDLVGRWRDHRFPAVAATGFLEWSHQQSLDGRLEGCSPLLLLFEALKWSFRLAVSAAVEQREDPARACK